MSLFAEERRDLIKEFSWTEDRSGLVSASSGEDLMCLKNASSYIEDLRASLWTFDRRYLIITSDRAVGLCKSRDSLLVLLM